MISTWEITVVAGWRRKRLLRPTGPVGPARLALRYRATQRSIQKLENRANSLIYQRYVALKTWLWAHSRTQKQATALFYAVRIKLEGAMLVEGSLLQCHYV